VNPLEKTSVLGFEAIRCPHCSATRRGDGGRHLEPQRQVGLPAFLDPALQLAQHGQVETAPSPLIGKGGVGEAVADHGGAARQRRLDQLLEVVPSCGEHQQRLGQCVHRAVQHQLTQCFGQRRAPGLARELHLVAVLAQPRAGSLDVRGLARAIDSFERDEAARFHRPRWY